MSEAREKCAVFGIYAPERDARLVGTSDLFGAIVGKQITVSGNANFHYDDWGRTISKDLDDYDATYEYRYGSRLYQVTSNTFPDEGDVTEADEGAGKEAAEPVLGYERTFKGGDGPAWTIAVAHDGVLRLMMLDLLGIGLEHFWSFPLALASVTVLDLSAGMVRLRAHNLDEHIAALSRDH